MVLYRAFGHVISDTPLAAVVGEAKKVGIGNLRIHNELIEGK